MLDKARQLFEDSRDLADNDSRWDLHFPMGVFGTLRQGNWNSRLMDGGKIALHCNAFMPHFIAQELSISFKKDACAPFEIYCYEPDQWAKMIPRVDCLESFSPKDAHTRHYGYYRTLAWLYPLPDTFKHRQFEHSHLNESRDLCLPPDKWPSKESRVPCWVYSNIRSNQNAKEAGVDTIIWG